MPAVRAISFLILIISFVIVSCSRKKGDTQPETLSTQSDTLPFTFNPENEFLGLGVQQFGDLDSMIARRRIRALVPIPIFTIRLI